MSISFTARANGPDVRLARRIFHGVERPDYGDVATLSPREARALAKDLIRAADEAEAEAEPTRRGAFAAAALTSISALRVEIARLEGVILRQS